MIVSGFDAVILSQGFTFRLGYSLGILGAFWLSVTEATANGESIFMSLRALKVFRRLDFSSPRAIWIGTHFRLRAFNPLGKFGIRRTLAFASLSNYGGGLCSPSCADARATHVVVYGSILPEIKISWSKDALAFFARDV
jgi:hypothetical protein